jgi:hypothetical protein
MNANSFAIRAVAVGRFVLSAGALRSILPMLLCAGWLSACGDPEQQQKQQLEQAVDQVTRILNDASRNLMAAAALQSTLEGGGTLIHYVVASLPDKFTHRVSMDRPEAAWSVVVHQTDNANEVIVEGYGADLTKPLLTRTAKIGPLTARRQALNG